jgi:hypothetical protein
LNLDVFLVDAAYSCEIAVFPAKIPIVTEQKRVVAARSQSRTITTPGIAAKQPN